MIHIPRTPGLPPTTREDVLTSGLKQAGGLLKKAYVFEARACMSAELERVPGVPQGRVFMFEDGLAFVSSGAGPVAGVTSSSGLCFSTWSM